MGAPEKPHQTWRKEATPWICQARTPDPRRAGEREEGDGVAAMEPQAVRAPADGNHFRAGNQFLARHRDTAGEREKSCYIFSGDLKEASLEGKGDMEGLRQHRYGQ